jgi:hypothetical protein
MCLIMYKPILMLTLQTSGLANRLWLFANVLALVRDHSLGVIYPALEPYASAFEGTCQDALCWYSPAINPDDNPALVELARCYRTWLWEKLGPGSSCVGNLGDLESLTPKVLRAAVGESERTVLAGFLTALVRSLEKQENPPQGFELADSSSDGEEMLDSPRFTLERPYPSALVMKGWRFRRSGGLESHLSFLRGFFLPRAEYRAAAERLAAALRPGCDLVVGVHVRRGDYVYWEEGKYYYSLEQYNQVMQSIAAHYAPRRVGFLIVSNEKVASLDFQPGPVSIGAEDAVVDLHALSLCDLIVGPPSTFSDWAAYMGGVPRVSILDPKTPLALPALLNKIAGCLQQRG